MQFIIDFKDDVAQEAIDAYFLAQKCTVISAFSALPNCFIITSANEPTVTNIVDTVTNDDLNPIRLLAFDNVSFKTADQAEWWKVASLKMPDLEKETQTYERRGASATVYVVDSGIMTTHPEFANSSVSDLFSFNGDFTDFHGHGTALASVICGSTCSIMDANVKSVKIFQNGTPTRQSDIVAAIAAIIDDVVANPNSIPVVNMSWSIPKNEYIESKITQLINAGVLVTAAAGNGGVPIANVTPASMQAVITIGAYNDDFTPCNFSDYTGPVSTTEGEVNSGALDAWAPGENIRVAILDGTYAAIAGTSIATAIMSAVLAYNSATYVLSDGSVPAIATHSTGLYNLSTSKAGILALGEQYKDSINKIATLTSENDGDNGLNYRTITNFVIASKSGVKIEKLAAPSFIVASFIIKNELPDGMVLDNGWLIGTIGTLTDTETFYWESPVTYTKHNGHVHESVMQFAIIPSGVDQSTIPEDDPVLAITLLACSPSQNTVSGFYSCQGSCVSGDFCHDACGSNKGTTIADVQCTCNAGEACM